MPVVLMTCGENDVVTWWQTAITEIRPGVIRLRGYAIEDLIGRTTLPEVIWLLLRGELPSPEQAELFGAALVASVDHGPHAPSIAIARMAMSSGVGINNAVASGINALGDIHGGAGKQAMLLFRTISERSERDMVSLSSATTSEVGERLARKEIIPGFGHRFHPIDPRAPRLLALVDEATDAGVVEGHVAAVGRAVEKALGDHAGHRIPMNIDGVTAIVYGELGFAPDLARGLFVLSRSVGILAHSWEQSQEGTRVKGPVPKSTGYAYSGPAERDLEAR
jgi:citrate synthase